MLGPPALAAPEAPAFAGAVVLAGAFSAALGLYPRLGGGLAFTSSFLGDDMITSS
jgi:hypothetical protein